MTARTRSRLVLLLATVALMTAGLIGAAVPAAARPAAVPGPTGPLDHFLCYPSTSPTSKVVPGFKPPATVLLANQFNPNGFKAKVRTFTTHCNPVQKTLPTGEVFKIQNPSWHLGCWSIVPDSTAAKFRVEVTNQFGTAVLDTKLPTQLCMPSLKSEKNPPTFVAPAAGEVQPAAFACYPVAYVKGGPTFTPPAFVRLRDQFTPVGAAFTVKVLAPKQLCLPTAVTRPGAAATSVKNPREHLVCFAVSGQNPAVLPRTVFDRNLFGVGEVTVSAAAQQLCVPTLKKIVG